MRPELEALLVRLAAEHGLELSHYDDTSYLAGSEYLLKVEPDNCWINTYGQDVGNEILELWRTIRNAQEVP